AAGGFEHRHGKMRAEKLAGETDVDRAPPVGGRDLVDPAGRTGDAGIVDEHIEAAEIFLDLEEQPLDIGLAGDVGAAGAGLSVALTELGEKIAGDVADMNASSAGDQRFGDGEADAGSAGRHQGAHAGKA